jgi:hypothetical protein
MLEQERALKLDGIFWSVARPPLDAGDAMHQAEDAPGMPLRADMAIRSDPRPEIERLADVEEPPCRIIEKVNPGAAG